MTGWRVNRHHHADKLRRCLHPSLFDQLAAEQRIRIILDQFAIEFLAPESGAGIADLHILPETRRQMGAVVGGSRPGHRRRQIGNQFLQRQCRPRRRGDDGARILTQAQCKGQHVPHVARLFPLGQLIAPRGVELRSAQALGFIGRKHLGDRSIRPSQQPFRRFVFRPLVMHVNAEQSGLAFDHHQPHFIEGWADDGDAFGTGAKFGPQSQRPGTHPFGSGAGLSSTAPAKDQPVPPQQSIRRKLLFLPPPIPPVAVQQLHLAENQTLQRPLPFGLAGVQG